MSARAHRHLPSLYCWISSIVGKKWEVFRDYSCCFTGRSLLKSKYFQKSQTLVTVPDICHENLNIIKNSNSAHSDLPNELFLFLGCIWQYKESKGVSLLASPDLWNKFSTKEHICCISIMVIIEMHCFFFFLLQIKSPSYNTNPWQVMYPPSTHLLPVLKQFSQGNDSVCILFLCYEKYELFNWPFSDAEK